MSCIAWCSQLAMSSFGMTFFLAEGGTEPDGDGDFISPGNGLLIGEGTVWGRGGIALGTGVGALLVLGVVDVGLLEDSDEPADVCAACNFARRFSLICKSS